MDGKQVLSSSEKVELMSEEAQEIVGRVPPWIVRWGITVAFCIVAVFLAGTFWIRYPDQTLAEAEVRFENQPLVLFAPASGWIASVSVAEGQSVRQGDTLYVLAPEGVITAGMEGVVSVSGGWSERQPVTSGEVLCTIVPKEMGTPWVLMSVPEAVSGQVQPGQSVLIKLNNYPATEYGVLEGRLESVAWTAQQGEQGVYYPARVSLPYGLTTQFHIQIAPSLELRGTAHILGKDRSLFNRMVQVFK